MPYESAIFCKAVPDNGNVVIGSGATRSLYRFFGSGSDASSPVKRLRTTLVIDPRGFNGSGLDLSGRKITASSGASGLRITPDYQKQCGIRH